MRPQYSSVVNVLFLAIIGYLRLVWADTSSNNVGPSITMPIDTTSPVNSAPASTSHKDYPYDYKIYTAGEKELTMNCLTVSPSQFKSPEIQEMRENLFHVLHKFRERTGFGRAIAAPQLGYPYRIVALHYNNTDITLYNPTIIDHSLETFTMWDDCLSFPDKMVCIRRYKSISVQFINDQKELVIWKDCSQDLSELLQHEIDHLNGIIAIDKAEKPVRKSNTCENKALGFLTSSVDSREANKVIPEGIVPRDDWVQRKEYYNQFVDFHY
jgi:peptide deformylase